MLAEWPSEVKDSKTRSCFWANVWTPSTLRLVNARPKPAATHSAVFRSRKRSWLMQCSALAAAVASRALPVMTLTDPLHLLPILAAMTPFSASVSAVSCRNFLRDHSSSSCEQTAAPAHAHPCCETARERPMPCNSSEPQRTRCSRCLCYDSHMAGKPATTAVHRDAILHCTCFFWTRA